MSIALQCEAWNHVVHMKATIPRDQLPEVQFLAQLLFNLILMHILNQSL